MLAESVERQSRQIFQNIEILFESIPDEEFSTVKGGFETWKQFYHLIHSIDKNLIDPGNFIEPDFHQKNMDIIFVHTQPKLSRSEIIAYYQAVKEKSRSYLGTLSDSVLEEVVAFKDLRLTKLELILAQLRHIFFHIGYLHCCLKIERGSTPDYVGIYRAVPEK